jgi:hypothetical protein
MSERDELIALRRLAELEAKASGKTISEAKPEKGFGQKLQDGINDIPRQVGLTARYGLEGVGDTLDFLSTPIRAGLNMVLPEGSEIKAGSGRYLANKLALPTPQNATERAVGDATRLTAGSIVPIGAANKLADVSTGVTRNVAMNMAAKPGMQAASAAAAGGAGGYTRETGGGDGAQLVASLAAGVATPLAISKGQQVAGSLNRLVSRPPAPQQIDITINNALRSSGVDFGELPLNIQNSIRQDVQGAMRTSGELSQDAVRRLADYRLTGATPTAATLTLDPAMVSQQKNLAKLGINSKDRAAQTLGMTENTNNRTLIDNLNQVGANTADDAVTGGRRVISSLESMDDAARSRINERYAQARATDGRSATLSPSHFTQRANDLLDEALLGGKLPSDVRNLLNKTAAGEMPLTVDTAEQLKTRIGDLQRASSDAAERKALGLVRSALDDTPLLDGQGQQAIDAFNKARRLNRAYMQIVERTPALAAVRDGIEPDKFVQQFIVGNGGKSNIADVQSLQRAVRADPQAVTAVREQIAAHLKKAALNGAADEVGNFSQSNYNKALNGIGDEKLRMFFDPEQVRQLRAVGRVASYEQFQPKGSAVNNSNTAGAGLAAVLDRVASSPILKRVPLGGLISEPVENIALGMGANRALNVPNALARPRLPGPRQPPNLLMSPAVFMGGQE